MKRLLPFLLILCVLLLPGCRKSGDVPAEDQAPVTESAPTPEPEPSSEPAQESVTAQNYYELLEGSWRMTSGETEGWEYDAREEDVAARLVFRPEGYVLYRYDDRYGNGDSAVFRAPTFTEGTLWDLEEPWYVTMEDDLSERRFVAGLDGERLAFADENAGGMLFFEREDAPVLLHIDLYETREAAASADPLAFYEIARRPEDEDTARYWAVMTAVRDDTRVRIERAASGGVMDSILAQEGVFLPGERIADVTLSAGSCIAAQVSLPWVTELRVTASCGRYFGEYDFGSDNYLHLDPTGRTRCVLGYPATLACADEYDLRTLLTGDWVYRDPGSGEITAAIRFDREGRMTVDLGGETGTFTSWFDRLYAEDGETPDLLEISPEEDALAFLPGFFAESGGGAYLIDLAQCDGELLLQLSQANNGDGALSWILPHTAGSDYSFLLHRYTGASDATVEHDGPFFPAIVWKADGEEGLLWLQPVTIRDEDEAGYSVYRPNPASPAAPLRAANDGVLDALRGMPDPAYPAEFFEVTIDETGAVAELN